METEEEILRGLVLAQQYQINVMTKEINERVVEAARMLLAVRDKMNVLRGGCRDRYVDLCINTDDDIFKVICHLLGWKDPEQFMAYQLSKLDPL